MKSAQQSALAGVLGLVLVWSTPSAFAGTSIGLTGSIAGIVRDTAGVPQMGATVLLFNHSERIVQRALTNERGAFGFEFLNPDFYSVRVNLSSFVPAMRHKIAVQPGIQSLLYINMATLLSSVELVYAAPGQGALMSDDWKWTLKTSAATRPILRFTPVSVPLVSVSDPDHPTRTAGAMFSDTRGLFKVSAGDDPTGQSDLGTAFALATSFFGRNQLQFSGNVGQSLRSVLPSTSLRTSFSHEGMGPEVSFTVRQINLPSRGSGLTAGSQDGLPALRTVSLALTDRTQLTDSLLFEYGMSLDSVVFIDHLNYLSPFARLTLDLGWRGTFRAAYSSGAPPVELFSQSGEAEAALHQDLIALAVMPRVSLRHGKAMVQRTQSMEVGYEKKARTRSLNLTAYREIVSNAGLTMADDGSGLAPIGDVLPSYASNTNTFNVGSYQRYGYSASVAQNIGGALELGASGGRGGVLTAEATPVDGNTGNDIRSRIHSGQRFWAAVRATETIPVIGTHISTNYQWTDPKSLAPTHLYLTEKNYQEVGWNIHIRQPLPALGGMPGRLEATADLRNLFADGYLAIPVDSGGRILLMQSPRAVRGGLSFIF